MTYTKIDQKMKTSKSKPNPRRQRWLLHGVVYESRAAYLDAIKRRVKLADLIE